MENINWGKVETASTNYAQPPAGGYILAICAVEDYPSKKYNKIYYDIAGAADKANEEFVGYYGQRKERSGGKIQLPFFIRSYKESARGYYKAFLVALEKSKNRGFIADNYTNDEQQFVGMVIGAVLGEEAYEWQGKKGIRLYVKDVYSVEEIQKGDFKIPALKAAKNSTPAAPVYQVRENEVPF